MKVKELQFLTDENIDWEVISYLRGLGFDVFDIKENGMFRMTDKEILHFAYLQNRVVISQDSDFGTLIFRDFVPVLGVMYLRPGHEKPEIHVQSMASILENFEEIEPSFILVAENLGETVKIRLRNI